MDFIMPMLIIRADIHSLIEVNGQIYGDVDNAGYIALPLSDTGEYYVTATPLSSAGGVQRLSITRKVTVEAGNVTALLSPDATLCAWPCGVYELTLSPLTLPTMKAEEFPYILDELVWQSGKERRTFTLYYERGLRLSAQGVNGTLPGYALGDGDDGKLRLFDAANAQLLLATMNTKKGQRLLAFDYMLKPLLDVSAGSIVIDDGCIYTINSKNTYMRHETRVKHEFINGEFVSDAGQIGFFTHERVSPGSNHRRALAFCEAVRENYRDEAMGYLTADLAKTIDFNDIREFFGDFSAAKAPISDDDGRTIGLIYNTKDGSLSAKLFSFEFAGESISNVSEY